MAGMAGNAGSVGSAEGRAAKAGGGGERYRHRFIGPYAFFVTGEPVFSLIERDRSLIGPL
jgi:hypothetical protein